MNNVSVTHVIYVAEGVKTRVLPMRVGQRRIELRIRPSTGSGPLERPRIVVVTDTLNGLPSNREGCDVIEVKRLPGNVRALITVSGTGAFATLRRPARAADRTDAELGPAILSMLQQVFPEHQFV